MSVRTVLGNYPFISPLEDDIRSGKESVTNSLITHINNNLDSNGIQAKNVVITEARYAAIIASQMLAKQQAQAYIEARNLIVQGAVDTVKDVTSQLSGLSSEAQEKVIVNLLTILAGNSHTQPTVSM